MKTEQVLKLTDGGCVDHHSLELTLFGPEAELMGNICSNLPREGDCHTFVCKAGHTHRVRVQVAFPANRGVARELRDFLRRLD
jgi:hypothetical protein